MHGKPEQAACRASLSHTRPLAPGGGFGKLWASAGGDAPEWADVARLKRPDRSCEIPAGVLFLTAGVDVQKSRSWGVHQES